MSGLVIDQAVVDEALATLQKIGTARIAPARGAMNIELEGWEFSGSAGSCRETAIKALVYLRSVLDAQIRTTLLVPGGTVICSLD